jgi:hypothetical protein
MLSLWQNHYDWPIKSMHFLLLAFLRALYLMHIYWFKVFDIVHSLLSSRVMCKDHFGWKHCSKHICQCIFGRTLSLISRESKFDKWALHTHHQNGWRWNWIVMLPFNVQVCCNLEDLLFTNNLLINDHSTFSLVTIFFSIVFL